MSYNVINPYQTFKDSTGEVRAAGIITFYDNLTTNLASIYSDEALTVAQSNPYTLDASGRIIGDVKYAGLLTLKIQNEDLSDIRTDDNVATLETSLAVSSNLSDLPDPFIAAGNLQSSYVVADKAEAAALTLTSADAERKIFIVSDDGGGFTVRFNATPGTYSDDGGSYTGTVFIPSGGDGTIGIVRDFVGPASTDYFGSQGDGSADDRAAFVLSDTAGSFLVTAGTYSIQSDITITNDIVFAPDAILKPASGITITINGAIDSGEYQIFDISAGGIILTRNVDAVYLAWFGLDGADDSSALNAAIAASESSSSDRYAPVILPPGDIYVNEIAWNNNTSLIGAEVGNSRLLYNGSGGAGSAIVKNAAVGGSTPFAGFYNITFVGWESTTDKIAEHCYKITGTTGTDWGAKFENVQFSQCFGDAIDLSNGIIVNLHMDRIRFDSVGGFGISIKTVASSENRPMSVKRFTLDNNITGGFLTRATTDGYYNGANWGKGVLKAIDTKGINMVFKDARIELNKNLITHDTRRCMFFIDQTLAASITSIVLDNILGFFQHADGGVAVFAKSSKTSCDFKGTTITAGAAFEDYAANVVKHSFCKDFSYKFTIQQDQGIGIQENQIEYRSSAPAGTVTNRYKRGDIIFNSAPSASGFIGWVCVSPTIGLSSPSNETLEADADATATSTTVTINTTTAMRKLFSYTAITIAGAGVAGADLDTYIADVDVDAGTITINTAASTTVSATTIKIQIPVFKTFGAISA